MFIEIEGDVWVQISVIQKCTMRHAKKEALMLIGGQLIESAIAYRYFMAHPELKANA